MKMLAAIMVIRMIIEMMTSKKNKETMYRGKKSTHVKHPAENQLR